MNAPASRGGSSARSFGRQGRRAVCLVVSLACLAYAPAGPLSALGNEIFERSAVPFLTESLSPARSPVLTAFLLALAAAAALLFALWRRAEASRSRERLAKDTRFRALLEETNEGVVAEAGGQIVYSNPAFRRLFQRHEGELLGKPLHLLFAPESRERLMEVRTALLDADPVPESYEAVALTPGGARFDVEIRAAMVSFEGREAMQMTLRDITRRKRAEVRLRRSEERYRSLFERSLAGVYRSDLAGKLMDCNDAFARILGFTSREEALGVPLTSYDFDPGDRARLTARLLAEKSLTNIEVRLRRKDGETVWVLKNEALARADDGSLSVLEGTIVDISDRRRAEQAIRESEERFRRLADATFEGIAITEEGRILETNRQFAALFEYEPEEMTGLSALELVAPESRELVSSHMQAGYEKPYEVLGRRKDGTIFPMEAWGRAMPYKGRTARVTAVRDITERKRAGEELHRSEEKYRDLVEGSEALICLHDLEGRLLAINPAAARGLGHEPASLVGRNIREFLPEKTWAAFDQYLEKIPTEGAAEGYMAVLTDQGEKRIWHYHNSLRAEGAAGPVVRGMAIDVTDQRRAEKALRDSETLYRLVTETVTDAILTMDAESTILFVNAAAEKVFGYTRSETLGQTITMLIPERLRHVYEAGISRYNRTGEKRLNWSSLQLPGRHKDGHEIPLELSFGEVIQDGKRLFTGIVRDISERARAEEALRRSQERYRDIFEFAPVGIYQSLPDGSLLTANATLAAMLGHASVEDLLGRNLADIYFDPDDREMLISQFEKRGAGRSLALRWKRKDGTAIWVELDAHAPKDEEGRIRYHEGFVHDITERKQAEEEKRYLQEQLAQSQKIEAVGQLAGGIAHDFNNLLTAIGGYSELLLGELPPGDPRRSHAEEVRKAGDRAASLTRQLLAYSRRQVLEPRVLDLNAIVLDLEKILRRLIGEQIQLRTRPLDGLWPVKADPGQIEQAILNLAINARDAMPDGGTLTIETANVELGGEYLLSHASVMPGPYAMVAVSDTGTGMNEEVKAHIFEPFFTTKEQGKGTGLGLSTTYGIVKQSGGYIWCYSEPGRGATFKLYLPRAQEVIEKASAPPAIPSPRTGQETILLVEDEPEVRSLVQKVLKMQGYTVLVAANAEEALTVSEEFKGEIAIMVSDVVMPGISGKQLADRLTASRPETKVLFMSGYTDDAIVHHGILDPGVAFLQKPFTPQALTRKVREVLDATPKEFKVS